MNQRTAKLLRKWSAKTKLPYKLAKRDWNSTPRNFRGGTRKAMEILTEP